MITCSTHFYRKYVDFDVISRRRGTPKMEELLWNTKRKLWKIVPKPFQMTPQIDEKSFKMKPGGTPKKRQKTKMKKNGWCLTVRWPPLGSGFREKWGPKMDPKIHKNQ